MPVKKSKKNKTTTKKTKKEIKEAIEKLPGLIYEHVDLKKEEPEEIEEVKVEPKIITPRHSNNETGKKRLLWGMMIFFTVIIFAMWIGNTLINIRDIKNGQMLNDLNNLTSVKSNLDESLEKVNSNGVTTTPVAELENIKNKIKNNLQNIIVYEKTSSSTTSTTN
jgi:copper chaperone CopZ